MEEKIQLKGHEPMDSEVPHTWINTVSLELYLHSLSLFQAFCLRSPWPKLIGLPMHPMNDRWLSLCIKQLKEVHKQGFNSTWIQQV